ncbi:MAG: hypothetical protein FJW37_08470 [Acidobacteria bacterium]|nr:hypothetical protein [Acidobacteriota bacterium]
MARSRNWSRSKFRPVGRYSRTAAARIAELARRLPEIEGAPIAVSFRNSQEIGGTAHAGALLTERRIVFERALARDQPEFARIFVHELFHFAWLRLGNVRRRAWERLLTQEIARGVRGELGWSSEWRKRELESSDVRARTRRWRAYCCESFCDSAAWLFSGLKRHPEFTLAAQPRKRRRQWFERSGASARIPI